MFHAPHKSRLASFSAVVFALVVGLVASAADAQQPSITPLKATGIYDLGEIAGWTLALPAGAPAPPGPYAYVVKKNNFEVVQSGALDLSKGPARLEVKLAEPVMLYVEITPPGDDSRPLAVAAAIAPTRLEPVAPRPADFDEFWAAKLAHLAEIPPRPVVIPGESGRAGVQYGAVTMDHVDGEHVYGQLAKPDRDGKFPALLQLQWASPPYPLDKAWVVDRAAQGWLAFNIEPHNVPVDRPQAFYDALPDELKHYESIGNRDRDRSYFLRMYLAAYRAVDYLAGRPDWDGKTLVVLGTSMGGQQGLCVAGLHRQITHLIVNVPAGCDTNGPLHGRQASYPNFPANDPQVMQTALYFDAVNFAPRIKATSLVAMGFLDTVSAPAGIWTAFNLIPGRKEAAPMIDSPHNHLATPEQQLPFTERSEQWLAALVRGEAVEVRGEASAEPAAVASAARPAPRTDANSQRAHEQLLAKARQGGIDLYFLGDSITRRWGTSDPQYADLLANWRANFFGWNAGNFGWGGDATQNILWRIQNGELDGVQPKVIVLLAGTNNLAGLTPAHDADAVADDVAAGVSAIVQECRRRAPDAAIILTAVFPRNDRPGFMPVIDAINRRLAKLADDPAVRFLNVNDRLAAPDGQVRPGMMHDGLHLTAAGYQAWADGLKPLLTELLGPPAATDHAPPPTGDPSLAPPPPAPAEADAAQHDWPEAAEISRRTALDFNVSPDALLAELRASIADVTQQDVDRWRAAGLLLHRTIDGELRYFRAAAANLFRLSREARERRTTEPPAQKKYDTTALVRRLVKMAADAPGPELLPVKHHVRYTLTVHKNHPRLKPGAVVRAWLPFPQEYRQQRDVRLIASSPPHQRLAASGTPQRSIYFEQTLAAADPPPRFHVEFEFTTCAYVPRLDPADVQPYEAASALYREFTAERAPHIILTPEVRALAAQIVGDETNPLEKVRRVFAWVSQNLPWVSEMEYSIIPSLSAKGLAARAGDCGVQGTTFITLCRAAGIPARWQSGWQTKPGDWNMHDWSEFYLEPWGWLPADASYGLRDDPDPEVRKFFCGHMDPYRLIVNLDYSRPFDPPKTSFRSEPVDFQRGEIEIDGHNLYFNEWDYRFEVESDPLAAPSQ